MIRRQVAKRQLSIEDAFLQSAKKSPNESESSERYFFTQNLHLLPINEESDMGGNETLDVRLYEKVSVRRWDVIQRVLSQKIDSATAFQIAVNTYNNRYARTWNVDCLSAALRQRPDFVPLLQKIADLALKAPDLVTQPVPLLRQNKERSLSLSQLQIACLLANAFYSTFPRRNATGVNSEYSDFPTINFSSLFCGTGYTDESNVEKIICLLHYFSRVFDKDGPPSGTVTFTRRCLHSPPDFSVSEVLVGSIPFGVSSSCLIEDTQGTALHVDFANRLLGGGVLHSGCVQEEILLCITPELLVGRLFLEALLPHEAILIFGAERFSTYTGYSRTFKWAGDFREADHGTVRDKEGRWEKVVTVIDAVCFSDPQLQFHARFLRRELLKAYAGFTDIAAPYRSLPAIVVSGHWGCGAFNGNKALKALLQLMASAQAGKALAYSTFGEELFAKEILRVYDSLTSSQCTVGKSCLLHRLRTLLLCRLWYILTHLEPPKVHTDEESTEYVFQTVLQQLTTAATPKETGSANEVILSYNRKYEPYWDVGSLSAALQKRPDFRSLLKKIADLALRLPELVTQPIPLLRQNKEMSLSLSQLQIACLLANAFYCTFPQRTSPGAESEYRNFPTINFISLFCTSTARTAGTLNSPGRMVKGKASSIKIEKLICLLHYFSRVLGEDGPPTGVVTFSRRCLEKPPDFESSEVLIGSVPFGTSPSCLIEDADGDNIHVDFANRFLGGGVLRWGCVQEEIMCVIKPEMLVGRLFLESLLPHEAALVFGAERFSNYTGYSGSFKWAGDFREAEHCESRDAAGRWKKVTAVIDAVRFTNPRVQFQKSFIQRELNKAYIGFTDLAAPYERLPATVISGHWGCGAYRGNKALKALIQLMACAQAGKALGYSTFGEKTFADDVQRVYTSLAASSCTVGKQVCFK
ncbi:unnamed protein product [Schistocephalus solidus]|uniref:poly(ADP-ribose) glycohydrolase n=1 Tax=Schistocephalus solidus TaxID=70667 RepID=A0A183SF10_SCHSO|nr:unnamed protein product [Schistocephalus solidus]